MFLQHMFAKTCNVYTDQIVDFMWLHGFVLMIDLNNSIDQFKCKFSEFGWCCTWKQQIVIHTFALAEGEIVSHVTLNPWNTRIFMHQVK